MSFRWTDATTGRILGAIQPPHAFRLIVMIRSSFRPPPLLRFPCSEEPLHPTMLESQCCLQISLARPVPLRSDTSIRQLVQQCTQRGTPAHWRLLQVNLRRRSFPRAGALPDAIRVAPSKGSSFSVLLLRL